MSADLLPVVRASSQIMTSGPFLLVTGLAWAAPSRFFSNRSKIPRCFSCPVLPGQARFLTGLKLRIITGAG